MTQRPHPLHWTDMEATLLLLTYRHRSHIMSHRQILRPHLFHWDGLTQRPRLLHWDGLAQWSHLLHWIDTEVTPTSLWYTERPRCLHWNWYTSRPCILHLTHRFSGHASFIHGHTEAAPNSTNGQTQRLQLFHLFHCSVIDIHRGQTSFTKQKQ